MPDGTFTQDYNRYTYARNNPLVYTDPDGSFWNFVIGAALGGVSGWKIGKAQGAKCWGMVGFVFGGAMIGGLTAGIGDTALGAFSTTANNVGSSIAAYSVSGAVAGMASGASFAALSGGDFWRGAAVGGIVAGTNHWLHPSGPSLRKRLKNIYKELMEIPEFAKGFAGGFKDFYETYAEMRDANLIDSDKYFHSKANFKATMRGHGGEYAAERLSNFREFLDQRWPKYDSKAASMEDQRANIYGRQQARYFREMGIYPAYKDALPLYRKNYFGNH